MIITLSKVLNDKSESIQISLDPLIDSTWMLFENLLYVVISKSAHWVQGC